MAEYIWDRLNIENQYLWDWFSIHISWRKYISCWWGFTAYLMINCINGDDLDGDLFQQITNYSSQIL